MKTPFIPIDYSYFDFEGKNYALVYGRDKNSKKICVIDSCDVYLWAILKDKLSTKEIEKLVDKVKNIEINSKVRKTKVEKVEVLNKNFLGKPVKALKIHATNYKDLHDIADNLNLPEIEKRRGYDLNYVTHYIIEKKLEPLNWYEIEGEILNNSNEFGGVDKIIGTDFVIKLNSFKKEKDEKFEPKVLAYDIETDDLKIGEGEILMISLVSKNFKKVITWKRSSAKKDYVEFVKDEKEMIEKFCEYVRKISPDFLVGYFSDGFDMPYIKERAKKLKIKLALGLDESQPRVSGGVNSSSRIEGITHIDLLKFISTTYAQYMQSETLTLNEVAKEFLKDEKKNFKIQHSSKLKDEHWQEYYEYNLHDSELTLKLFDKFWPDIMEFSKIIKEPTYEVSRNGLSKQMESYILHNLEKFNEIPEKRPMNDEISERQQKRIKGAFVYEPTPGLYENIAMFDFTSMHTSIIISYNISKETLEEKGANQNTSPEIDIEGKKKIFYFTKKPGFIPTLLKEIFEKRKQYKEEYKKNPDIITKARSNAFKLLSASAHGYIGFFGARYYSLECSSSILAFVRKFNIEMIKKIEKLGYKVIYGDTDSVAFLYEKNSKEKIREVLKKLNDELPGVMEMELEGFFKRGIWVTTREGTAGAKKKYAMIKEDGEIRIRGFETVRRDWCKLAREVQDKIIRMILNDGNEKNALIYIKEIIKKIKSREIKKEDLIIKTQLKKPISEYKAISPHVIAAKKMKEAEEIVSHGGLIEYYIAETKSKTKLVRDKVKLPDEKGEYNIKYYLKNQILPAVENIFQIFNIDVNVLADGKKQMTLKEF
jgi:DNA polymerase I/DNA polymerase-2